MNRTVAVLALLVVGFLVVVPRGRAQGISEFRGAQLLLERDLRLLQGAVDAHVGGRLPESMRSDFMIFDTDLSADAQALVEELLVRIPEVLDLGREEQAAVIESAQESGGGPLLFRVAADLNWVNTAWDQVSGLRVGLSRAEYDAQLHFLEVWSHLSMLWGRESLE